MAKPCMHNVWQSPRCFAAQDSHLAACCDIEVCSSSLLHQLVRAFTMPPLKDHHTSYRVLLHFCANKRECPNVEGEVCLKTVTSMGRIIPIMNVSK
eukprot:4295416-Amphidinium_carterae.2